MFSKPQQKDIENIVIEIDENPPKRQQYNNQVITEQVMDAIKKGEENINVLDGNKNQESILLLGMTGAGKSTIAALFSGVIFRGILCNSKKVKLDVSKDSLVQLLKDLVIGHSAESSTTVPNILKDLLRQIYLVDLPGFDDNRGITQEIINGFYIYRVFKTHKSVKIFFTFTQQSIWDGRGKMFVEAVKKVVHSFKKQNYLHSIGFIVTQADVDQTGMSIASAIQENFFVEEAAELRKKLDPEIIEFMHYIVKNPNLIQVMKKPEGASDNLEKYYNQFKLDIYALINTLQPMENPTIYTSVSDEAKKSLENYIQVVKKDVKDTTQKFMNDIDQFFSQRKIPKLLYDENYNKKNNEEQFRNAAIYQKFLNRFNNIINNQELKQQDIKIFDELLKICQNEFQIKADNIGTMKNQMIVIFYFRTIIQNLDVEGTRSEILAGFNQKHKDLSKQYEQFENQILDMINIQGAQQFDKLSVQFKDCSYTQNWKNNATKFFQFVATIQQQQSFKEVYDYTSNEEKKSQFKINLSALDQFKEVLDQCNQHLDKDRVKSILPKLKEKLKETQLEEFDKIKQELAGQKHQQDNIDKQKIQDLKNEVLELQNKLNNNELHQQLKEVQQQNLELQEKQIEIQTKNKSLNEQLQKERNQNQILTQKTSCCEIF